jgi:hypothetical protein
LPTRPRECDQSACICGALAGSTGRNDYWSTNKKYIDRNVRGYMRGVEAPYQHMHRASLCARPAMIFAGDDPAGNLCKDLAAAK